EQVIAQARQSETRLGAGISAQRADHLTLVEQTGQRVSLVREALPVVFGRDALHPPGSLEEVFQEEAGHVLVLGRVLRPALQQLLHGDGIACVPGLSALPQEFAFRCPRTGKTVRAPPRGGDLLRAARVELAAVHHPAQSSVWVAWGITPAPRLRVQL